MKRIRVLVADDHEIVRRGLRATVEAHPDWEVVGEARNGREAVELSLQLRPHIVVLDVSMPELNGLEATRRLREQMPSTRILVLTVHESEQIVREVLKAGAQGYLLKSDAGHELEKAIEALIDDKPFFTSKVAHMVLNGFLQTEKKESAGLPAETLSAREKEIVQHIAEGKSNKEVAALLGISVKTVETHRTNIMRKLDLHSVTELVLYAVRNKLIQL